MGTTQMFCLNDYLRDLQEVVDLDCGSSNCAGVTRAAEIMKRRFDAIGFAAELVDLGSQAGRGLFAVNQPNAEHYDVLFNAHLDTVYPDGTAALRPFTVGKERITGP
ncbi:MAG: M20 family peptidase, partial [Sutterella sp.]|nr:M20 family peptidase [Sutterella sp.]